MPVSVRGGKRRLKQNPRDLTKQIYEPKDKEANRR
jgi:hypothetical protein